MSPCFSDGSGPRVESRSRGFTLVELLDGHVESPPPAAAGSQADSGLRRAGDCAPYLQNVVHPNV